MDIDAEEMETARRILTFMQDSSSGEEVQMKMDLEGITVSEHVVELLFECGYRLNCMAKVDRWILAAAGAGTFKGMEGFASRAVLEYGYSYYAYLALYRSSPARTLEAFANDPASYASSEKAVLFLKKAVTESTDPVSIKARRAVLEDLANLRANGMFRR